MRKSYFTTILPKFNDEGQLVEVRMLDESSQVPNEVAGVDRIINHYDEFGNVDKMVTTMRVNGFPSESEMIIRNGVMRESLTTINNQNGKAISRSFFGGNMQIGLTDEGVSAITVNYDPNGLPALVKVMRRASNPQSETGQQGGNTQAQSQSEKLALPKLELVPCVVIDEVFADGNAEKAGLRQGDRVLRYGNKETPNSEALVQLVNQGSDQKEVEIVAIRELEILKLKVMPGQLGVRLRDN